MDLMEMDDDIDLRRSLTMEALIPNVDIQRRKSPSRCASVCLGLLCAVLLAGNIGQILYYSTFSRPPSADMMKSAYSTGSDPLLEAKLSNLTTDKDQLQKSYNALRQDRDELKKSRDDLQREKAELQSEFSSVSRDRDAIKIQNINLTESESQLQSRLSSLRSDKEALQTGCDALKEQKEQLQISYTSLEKDREELEKKIDGERGDMTKEREQLRTHFDALQREKDQLRSDYSRLSTAKDQLEKKVNKIKARPCETGWTKFDISCFSLSTQKKNWTVSRNTCLSKGADLVIVDSREKQVFINGMLEKGVNAWIGMTDTHTEGTWTWVDGTPVTTTYWQEGQPNSYEGNQDCGEFVQTNQIGGWNDDGCFAENVGICEK